MVLDEQLLSLMKRPLGSKKYSLRTPKRGNEMLLAPQPDFPDRKDRSGIKFPGHVFWEEWMDYVVEERGEELETWEFMF
jgi:hypothetical protein